MTDRIYSRLSIDELEKLFDEKRTNVDVLMSILGELSHRRTSRAKSLKRRVMQGLSVASMAVKEKSGSVD